MTDPFSIAVGALAVVGAARKVGKTVSKLRSLENASEEYIALQNEVSDMEAVLQQVAMATSTPVASEQEQHTDDVLRHQVDRAKSLLLELEELTAYALTKYSSKGEAKVDIIPWYRQQERLRTLRERLRNHRMNLALSIATVAFYFERVFRASVAIKTTGIAQSIFVTRVRDYYCPLWQYTRDNEIPGIQSLFDTSRASPYDVNIFGQSALHVNVIRSACRFPITNGAGKYPLETQKLDLCQFLIQQGADPYLQDKNGKRPIDHAWENILARRLLPQDESRLAVLFQDPEYIETRQFTRIHKIVIGISEQPLESELKERTTDIDAIDAHGKTALAWASARKDHSTLRTLLNAGADPDIFDVERYTPLFHAAEAPDPQCVALLLSHGSDPSFTDARGATAFHRACGANDDPLLLDPFISAGIDINLAKRRSGDTGLASASQEGRLKNVRYLLDAGASPNIINAAGETAVFMAIHHNRPEILKALLEAGADPKIRNHKNQTILHSAARLGRLQVLSVLQDVHYQAIDPLAKDDTGMTAKDYFAERMKVVDVDQVTQEAFRGLMQLALMGYHMA